MFYCSHDESLLRASTDVTEALRRTSTLMQQELEKSTYTTTMLGMKFKLDLKGGGGTKTHKVHFMHNVWIVNVSETSILSTSRKN